MEKQARVAKNLVFVYSETSGLKASFELTSSLHRLIELGYTISQKISCEENVSPAFESKVDAYLMKYTVFLSVLID
jgi:hypothetical protein